jgi:hypothetical protein
MPSGSGSLAKACRPSTTNLTGVSGPAAGGAVSATIWGIVAASVPGLVLSAWPRSPAENERKVMPQATSTAAAVTTAIRTRTGPTVLRGIATGGGGTRCGSSVSRRRSSLIATSPSNGVDRGGGSIFGPPTPGAIGGELDNCGRPSSSGIDRRAHRGA